MMNTLEKYELTILAVSCIFFITSVLIASVVDVDDLYEELSWWNGVPIVTSALMFVSSVVGALLSILALILTLIWSIPC